MLKMTSGAALVEIVALQSPFQTGCIVYWLKKRRANLQR